MNWFHKIFKFAKPKDKVIKYKITDNILINFINKYENLVPWQTIKDQQDLQKFIQDHLVKPLFSKIVPHNPDNNYLKDIDIEKEIKQNPNDPQIQQAYQLYKQDPKKGKDFLLDHINKGKMRDFYIWHNYLNQENDIYKENPAFIYLIAKPIIDSSGPTVKASIPSLNANTVAKMYEGLSKEIFEGNLLKAYQEQLALDNVQTSQYVPTDNKSGWIRIPSQTNDLEHFSQNADKLKNFSIPNKWCTGSGLAEPYLKQGDFWLYIQEGMAKIAIRLIGNNVSEIRGYNNEQDYTYRKEVVEFLEKSDFNYKNNSQYNDYKLALKMNSQIRESENPEATAIKMLSEGDFIKNMLVLDKDLLTPKISQFINDRLNEEVKKDGYAIQYIKNPSEQVQLLAVQQYGSIIEFIKNPSEQVQLEAVKSNGYAIEYIENPSEQVQLEAVKRNGSAIKHIKNPSEQAQSLAVQQDGYLIKYINNPSEQVQELAVKKDAFAIYLMIDRGIVPSEKTKELARSWGVKI